MAALAKLLQRFSFSSRREDAPKRASGDDGDGTFKSRPMVGLYAQLTPEQRARVLAYEGPIESGRADLPRLRDPAE